VAISSDALLDRRRLKRRLTLWRVIAILLAAAGVGVAVDRAFVDHGDYVARLVVSGIVFQDDELLAAIEDLQNDRSVRAVVVRIDTPGGTVVGGELLYRALRNLGQTKPVVAAMDTVATSAGYMIALGADHILAHSGTITGSIGVIMQMAEVSGLLERLGITAEAIRSGPLKGRPSPLEPMSPEVRVATQAVVDDMYALFVDMVAERRGLDRDRVLALADGRIFTGRQAVAARLVDGLGGEAEARAWLQTRGIDPGLPIRDLRIERGFESWLDTASRAFGKTLFSERLTLDGLISVWHPQLR